MYNYQSGRDGENDVLFPQKYYFAFNEERVKP